MADAGETLSPGMLMVVRFPKLPSASTSSHGSPRRAPARRRAAHRARGGSRTTAAPAGGAASSTPRLGSRSAHPSSRPRPKSWERSRSVWSRSPSCSRASAACGRRRRAFISASLFIGGRGGSTGSCSAYPARPTSRPWWRCGRRRLGLAVLPLLSRGRRLRAARHPRWPASQRTGHRQRSSACSTRHACQSSRGGCK